MKQQKKRQSKTMSVCVEAMIEIIRYMHRMKMWMRRGALSEALNMEPGMVARALAYLVAGNHIEQRGQTYRCGWTSEIRKPSPSVVLEEIFHNRRTTRTEQHSSATIRNSFSPGTLKEENLARMGESKTGGAAVCCGAVAGAHRVSNENEDIPIEMRASECLVYHGLLARKTRNAEEGRKEREIDDYHGSYTRWDEIQDLLLYLVRMEPLAWLMWKDYRDKAFQRLDDLIPDWKHSMAWATRKVLGEAVDEGDYAQCDDPGEGSFSTWPLGDDDDVTGQTASPEAPASWSR
jgi:hypothetical protein